MTIQVNLCISDRPKGHLRSRDVIKGQLPFLGNNSRPEQDTGSKIGSSCLARQDGSTDMQHDLFGKVYERSNFKFDLKMSSYTSFDAY